MPLLEWRRQIEDINATNDGQPRTAWSAELGRYTLTNHVAVSCLVLCSFVRSFKMPISRLILTVCAYTLTIACQFLLVLVQDPPPTHYENVFNIFGEWQNSTCSLDKKNNIILYRLHLQCDNHVLVFSVSNWCVHACARAFVRVRACTKCVQSVRLMFH